MRVFKIFTNKVFFFSMLLIFVLFLTSFFLSIDVFSDTLQEYEEKIEEKKEEKEEAQSYLERIEDRIEEIRGSDYSLSRQIQEIEAELQSVEEEMERVKEEIEDTEEYIEQKEEELNEKEGQAFRVSDELYRNSRVGFFEILFSGKDAETILRSLVFNRHVVSSQIDLMKEIAKEMKELNEEKENLAEKRKQFEEDREGMEESQNLLAQERSQLHAELAQQQAERETVTRRIGGLEREISETQDFLLRMRSGGTIVSADSVGKSGGTSSLSYFLDNAPSGSFGVFSFGAHTHRDGMSQWGAWARNRDGQSFEEILSFYYPNASLKTKDNLTEEIEVDGYGTKDFEEEYLLGIREIHGSWNTSEDMGILKAQVIAARSYAIAHTSNGSNSICATESCQVYSDDHYDGAWKEAVEKTEGQVMVEGGSVKSTKYAAVHGGWVNDVGYDLDEDHGSWNMNLNEQALWDQRSGVSWFYHNWHQHNNSTCSTKPDPWLTNEEMADLINAYLYWTNADVKEDDRLTAVDIGTCWGKSENPYSHSDLKGKVEDVGDTPVSSVHGVSVENSNGWTQSITFNTDIGGVTVNNPTAFREVYNMRAPAFFHIPQSNFVHINIEEG